MDGRDYKLPVGADQTEAGMGLCPIPLPWLCDKVFTEGSRLLARASPLTERRELNSIPSSHVCRSRGNMLARLFLSFEEMWLPQNSGPGSGYVEQVSGAVEGQWWASCPPGDSAMLGRPV